MTAEYFPEQTIRYKTYIKRTLVEALTKVFKGHPDALIQNTKVTIEFPKTEIDFPSVVVRFFEREIFNAGVGHQEVVYVNGESDSIEVSATLNGSGAAQLTWPAIEHATGYKVYSGLASDKQNKVFTVSGNSFTDAGQRGDTASVPTVVTAAVDSPQPSVVVAPGGQLSRGTHYYRVTALTPSQAVKFKHYFYNADIELAVYALSSLDRDLIADSLVQTIAMGSLEPYTNNFFQRVYPDNLDLYPDANLHFIDVGSDRIQGFGESQAQTPWGAEDDLMYTTSYRFAVFGELYSLPPQLSYELVQRVLLYFSNTDVPSDPQSIDPGAQWVSNFVG